MRLTKQGIVDEIAVLSPLLGCDLPAFLSEADQPTISGHDDHSIEYVVVGNVTNWDRYEPDPAIPDEPIEWLDDDAAAEQDRIDAGADALDRSKPTYDG